MRIYSSQKNVLHVLQNTQISYQSTDLCVARCFFVCYKNAESVAGHWIYAQHETCYIFLLLHFQVLITSIITFSMYAVSRTIQNPSFNTPYDVTTRIKYQFCKIIRFSLKSSLYTIFWCYTTILKNNPYSFPGRDFVCLLVKLTFGSHVNTCIAPVWMSCSHVSVHFLESVLCFVPFFCCHNRNLLFFLCMIKSLIIFIIKPDTA